MDRTTFLTFGLDRDTFGVEIGPFFNPIAPKAKGWQTTVIDYTDQNGLLDVARNHTAQVIRDMASNIEFVDVVWKGEPIDEACLKIRQEGFHYLIASHVIEHTPDFIGFLRQVSNLANDNFILSLAVPDCRRTFDFFKPLSTTADALLAYRQKRAVHSPETMFIAYAYALWVNGVGAWLPGQTGELSLPDTLDEAHAKYTDYLASHETGTQTYVDSHCWYWTPSSFELMILELNHLGYIDFTIETLESQPSSEFLVRLKKGKYNLDVGDVHERRMRLLRQIRVEMAEAPAMLLAQDEAATDLQSTVNKQEVMLTEALSNLAIAQQKIIELENSNSWKLTKPLRTMKSMLR